MLPLIRTETHYLNNISVYSDNYCFSVKAHSQGLRKIFTKFDRSHRLNAGSKGPFNSYFVISRGRISDLKSSGVSTFKSMFTWEQEKKFKFFKLFAFTSTMMVRKVFPVLSLFKKEKQNFNKNVGRKSLSYVVAKFRAKKHFLKKKPISL